MKKTIISIILVLVLTISLVFVLVACNNGGKTDTPTNTQTTNTGDNGSTNNNNGGTTNNGGGDNNGGNSGGQQGGGDTGNNNGGTTTTYTTTLSTAQQIATAVGTTFKVTATNLSGQTPTTVASDGTYFYVYNLYEKFSKKYSENNYQYYAQQANNKYIFMYSTNYKNNADISVLSSGNLELLFLYA